MKFEIDLNMLNAEQIALLDAVVSSLPVPSKTKNEIIDAGYANCGENEYRAEYIKASNKLNGNAIAAAVQQEREANATIIHSMAEGYRFVGYKSMDKIAEALDEASATIRARNGAWEDDQS